MQKLLFFGLLLLISATSFSQEHNDKLDLLIRTRQYESAWKILEKEKNDSIVDDVVLKSAFALKYFAHTLYHQKFYFANLEDSATLLQYRQTPPSTDLTFSNFNPEQALKSLLAKYPNDSKLHLALGDYYYDVYITYHDQWKKDTKELMALFYYHYQEAYQQNMKNDQSVYAISLFYQSRKTFGKAKQYLNECLELNSFYAPAHYNLAYSYSLEDSTYLAIAHAQKAYEYYEKSNLKADAASMCGILLTDLKKHEDAINWLLISDALAPGNYYVYQSLLKNYLALGKEKEADLITRNLYNYDWRTGKVYNDILECYISFQQEKKLESYLLSLLKEEPYDEEFRGFAHLHLAQLYYYTDQIDNAKSSLSKARKSFGNSYDPDHAIYRVIEKFEYTIQNL